MLLSKSHLKKLIYNILRETVDSEQLPTGGSAESIRALVIKVFETAIVLESVSSQDPRLLAVCENDVDHSWVAEEAITWEDLEDRHSLTIAEIIASSPAVLFHDRFSNDPDAFSSDAKCVDIDVNDPTNDTYIVKCMPSEKYIEHRVREIEMMRDKDIGFNSSLTSHNSLKAYLKSFFKQLVDDKVFFYKYNDPKLKNLIKEYERQQNFNLSELPESPNLYDDVRIMMTWLHDYLPEGEVETYLEIKTTKTDNEIYKFIKMPPDTFFNDLTSLNLGRYL